VHQRTPIGGNVTYVALTATILVLFIVTLVFSPSTATPKVVMSASGGVVVVAPPTAGPVPDPVPQPSPPAHTPSSTADLADTVSEDEKNKACGPGCVTLDAVPDWVITLLVVIGVIIFIVWVVWMMAR
jgi:hypothetical protein